MSQHEEIQGILTCLGSLRSSITALEDTVERMQSELLQNMEDLEVKLYTQRKTNVSPYQIPAKTTTELDDEVQLLTKAKKEHEKRIMDAALKRHYVRKQGSQNPLTTQFRYRPITQTQPQKRLNPSQLFPLTAPTLPPLKKIKIEKKKEKEETRETPIQDIEDEMFPPKCLSPLPTEPDVNKVL